MSIFQKKLSSLGTFSRAAVNYFSDEIYCSDTEICPYDEAPIIPGLNTGLIGSSYGEDNKFRAFLNFSNVDIPRSAYINSAVLKLWVSTEYPWIPYDGGFRSYVENANNPTLPLNFTACKIRSLSPVSSWLGFDAVSPYATYEDYSNGIIREGLPTYTFSDSIGNNKVFAQISLNVSEAIQYAVSQRWWDRYDTFNLVFSNHSASAFFYFAAYSPEYPDFAPELTVDHDAMAVILQFSSVSSDKFSHNHPELAATSRVDDKALSNWGDEGEVVMTFEEIKAGFEFTQTMTEASKAEAVIRAGFQEDKDASPNDVHATVTVEAEFYLPFDITLDLEAIDIDLELSLSMMLDIALEPITAEFEVASNIYVIDQHIEALTADIVLGRGIHCAAEELVGSFRIAEPTLHFDIVELAVEELIGSAELGNQFTATLSPIESELTFSIEQTFQLSCALSRIDFASEFSLEGVMSLDISLGKFIFSGEMVKKVELVLNQGMQALGVKFTITAAEAPLVFVLAANCREVDAVFTVAEYSGFRLAAELEPVQVNGSIWNDYSDVDVILRYKDKL